MLPHGRSSRSRRQQWCHSASNAKNMSPSGKSQGTKFVPECIKLAVRSHRRACLQGVNFVILPYFAHVRFASDRVRDNDRKKFVLGTNPRRCRRCLQLRQIRMTCEITLRAIRDIKKEWRITLISPMRGHMQLRRYSCWNGSRKFGAPQRRAAVRIVLSACSPAGRIHAARRGRGPHRESLGRTPS